jgi:hypothetical protein
MSTPVNPVAPVFTIASLTTPGSYTNEGGPLPSDAPSGVGASDAWTVGVAAIGNFIQQIFYDNHTGSASVRYSYNGTSFSSWQTIPS